MMDANQVWDVAEAIEWVSAPRASSTAAGSRSRPAPTTCSATPPSPGDRADQRRHRRALQEPRAVQAAAAGRGDRLLPARRVPARRRQRGPGGAADGGEIRRAGLPACGRRRTLRVRPAPLDLRLHRVGGILETGCSSTSTTCTSTSSIPCGCAAGTTSPPSSRATRRRSRPRRWTSSSSGGRGMEVLIASPMTPEDAERIAAEEGVELTYRPELLPDAAMGRRHQRRGRRAARRRALEQRGRARRGRVRRGSPGVG